MPHTRLYRLKFGVAAAALLATATPYVASAATVGKLTGNVASFIANAASSTAAPDSTPVSILVHMNLKNLDQLKALADAVSDPANALHGRYLTAAQFAQRFAADAADVASVRAMLAAGGMTNIVVGPANSYVAAQATVRQLRDTFAVSQNMYTVNGRTLRANKEAPTVPASLVGKIMFIEGLDDTDLKQTHHLTKMDLEGAHGPALSEGAMPDGGLPPPVAFNLPGQYCDTYFGDLRTHLSTQPAPYGNNPPWEGCGYAPAQIQAAYGLNQTTFNGKGITVAITDAYASPTLRSDANQYSARHNLPQLGQHDFAQDIPPNSHGTAPKDALCLGHAGWWGEQSLDVDAVHTTAPGASILYVGALDCAAPLTQVLFDTIYNRKADIVTNSWGEGGENGNAMSLAAYDQAFMAAATMGVSVLFSSGDDGDLTQINGVASGSSPSTSPYATSVGGTTLALLNASGLKYEWGWGEYRAYLANATVNSGTSVTTTGLATTTFGTTTYPAWLFTGASGGGLSLHEAAPSYQHNIVPTKLALTVHYGTGGTTTLAAPGRVVPDVSMTADPYFGFLYGESYTTAGDPINDYGCTSTSTTVEYCENPIGGTSVASPLMAGMLAVVNQAHAASGRPLVGFANPWFYKHPVGTTGLRSAGINDVKAPTVPLSFARGFLGNPNLLRLITINSVSTFIRTAPIPTFVCQSFCQGLDDFVLYTEPGYDAVTGLGVPYAPRLITQ